MDSLVFFPIFFAIFILGSSSKKRQKLVNTLIIHQGFVDLLASIALISMAHIDGAYQHDLEGLQAEVFCFFVNCKLPLWLMIDVSSFNLMFLNMERYISIVFPIYHHTKVTRKKVLLFLPIVWFFGALEQGWVCSGFFAENGTCSLDQDIVRLIVIAFVLLHFFLPVTLVLFLYGHMFIRLRPNVKSGNDPMSSNRSDAMEKARNNVFKTMLLITTCYAVCFVFNSIYGLLISYGIFKSYSGK